jgi:RimJ/RimL family protein N-acetyltransferase
MPAHERSLAVISWALDDRGLFRLELGHRTNNPASCAVARRAGFVVEGLQRGKLRYGDARFDVELHARLVTDPVPPSGTETPKT